MAANKQLEIERKFLYNSSDEFEKSLLELGAVRSTQVGGTFLLDDYYDDEASYFLVLNDCWLRKRQKERNSAALAGGKWELKYRARCFNSCSIDANFSQYFELVTEKDIIAFILDLANQVKLLNQQGTSARPAQPNIKSVAELIQYFNLKLIARIETNRRSYSLAVVDDHDDHDNSRPSQIFQIDLDSTTSFDYNLGEIEAVFDQNKTEAAIKEATEKMNEICRKLGKVFTSNDVCTIMLIGHLNFENVSKELVTRSTMCQVK
jgi:hypothetical protein